MLECKLCVHTLVHTKVPYVDPPQLNTIRHKKFRTQHVLFRAVPSEYLWERYISNFVPWSKSFGSGKLLYRLCTSENEIYRIFVPWPKVPAIDVSFPAFRGTTHVEPSCGTELCGTRPEQCGAAARTTCGSAW
eukprot:SAG11_NODE_204_length_12459_cov_6.526133_14_plen_133_part_00